MPLIVFHTDRVRAALKAPARLGTEAIVFVCLAGAAGAVFLLARQWSAPLQEKVEINLAYTALPGYTLLSLMRGFAAYLLSLAFTLVYAPLAASSPRAEKIMLPVLDILQSIPVLGFLPGLVLALVGLFPTRQLGLELACVLMIFTGQAWNMTFSFHGSLKSIPTTLREAASLNGFTRWQTFKRLEVPASMIGLVWNSMMSMAGGWFFLTINEAFTLRDQDFRLPGLGSYLNEAIHRFDAASPSTYGPMLAGIIAMLVMIVAVDQLFWRPIVVWAQRFKLEELSSEKPQSWVLSLFERSALLDYITRTFRREREKLFRSAPKRVTSAAPTPPTPSPIWPVARVAIIVTVLAALALGLFDLVRLVLQLPVKSDTGSDWLTVVFSLLASFARTSASILIGAAWCLPLGILIGRSPSWSRRLQPIVQVAASFPAPVLFPLVTLLLSALHVPFTLGCVALMLLGSQWYILFNVIAGASAIPADLKEAGTVYRLTRNQRWFKLYIPCVFPYLVTGLLTAAGGAWNATIVSEYVLIKDHEYIAFGLGSLISKATNKGDFPLLTASVLTMALFVVTFNTLCWKRLYRLAERRYTLQT